MRKLIRRIKFYFLFKGVLLVATNATKKQPIAFPALTQMTFGRDRILEYYLANYSMTEALRAFFDEENAKAKRKIYKIKNRATMLESMNEEEFFAYHERLEQWKQYHDFDEARAQFEPSKS